MSDRIDRAHMARALQLAARGRFHAAPNPHVGCVLVAPMKYNAISGFGLEVLETIRPAAGRSGEPR
jgi:pyrimidine deaminase RibD-like protein